MKRTGWMGWLAAGLACVAAAGRAEEPVAMLPEVVVTAAEKAARLSAGDERDTQRIPAGGTPGYGVLSLRGGVRARESLQLTLALENLADEDYRIHGSGVNEPGRNLVVQAEWTF